MLDEMLAAAEALIDERHGADSAVAARFREHMAGHAVPICVYRCKENTSGGFACAAGIAVHEDYLTVGTVAHEVAHVVLCHYAERESSLLSQRDVAHSGAKWGLGSLAWAVASRPTGRALLSTLAGLSLMKGWILRRAADPGRCLRHIP